MKKFLASTISAMFLLSTTTFAAPSEISFTGIGAGVNDESPVLASLRQRVTTRDFVDKDLTNAQLGKILWAANGINRENGKRVIPAAMGVYSVEVYAVTREGIYLYDPDNYKINLIAEGDYRMTTTTGQSFAGKAAVNLVYVETPAAWKNSRHTPPPRERQIAFANITVGAMIQGVALAAQAEGLGNCVRGSINREDFAKVAKLSADKNILLAQSVGFTK